MTREYYCLLKRSVFSYGDTTLNMNGIWRKFQNHSGQKIKSIQKCLGISFQLTVFLLLFTFFYARLYPMCAVYEV